MKHRDEVFKARTVRLDGNEYVGCRFEGCTLVYDASARALLDDCDIDACKLSFQGRAGATLVFLQSLYAMGGDAKAIIDTTFDVIRGTTRHGHGPAEPAPHGKSGDPRS